ncbi:hypothetical protein BRYFOR_09432 [Marvinbryantia formatexigens DSM 14469]|uniref:Uncharacterized protein n=1 Tax=Marvinbryantia formatexigens DSM 14469 TaxID=478749 RepID=C6LL85_9FIRM|nr:hypothetical protein BRYFOR_09432 [Marvinbryantia formatexigens DSM 14469]
MYMTNIIRRMESVLGVMKIKSVFPSDTVLEKMLYLASENVNLESGRRNIGTGIRCFS